MSTPPPNTDDLTRQAGDVLNCFKAGNRDGTEAGLDAFLSLDNTPAKALRNAAKIAVAIAEIARAEALSTKAYEQSDQSLTELLDHASLLTRLRRHAKALAVLESTSSATANTPGALHLRGVIESQMGRFDNAERLLRQALDNAPISGVTWRALSEIKTFTPSDPDIARLRQTANTTVSTADDRAQAQFAFGKALDDLGHYDDAMNAFQAGAAFYKPSRPFNASADEANARAIVEALNQPHTNAAPTSDDFAPIFVLGLPRSGTTLLERKLAASPDTSALGESALARGAFFGFAPSVLGQHASSLSEQTRAGIAATYQRLAKELGGAAKRPIDKSISLSRICPALAAAIPAARFVIIRRAPLDVAASCFRAGFAEGHGWAFDMNAMARHFRAEDMVLETIERKMSDRAIAIDYEELVSDEHATLTQVRSFLGLAAPANTPGTGVISSASLHQARQPVTAQSIGRGSQYRSVLMPFLAAYTQQPTD